MLKLPLPLGFEWDDGNKDKNWLKHKVLNSECEQVFFNQPLVLMEDRKHSQEEKRFAVFGRTNNQRLLTIVFTPRKARPLGAANHIAFLGMKLGGLPPSKVFTVRGQLVRIISARDAHRKERSFYEKHKEENAEIRK